MADNALSIFTKAEVPNALLMTLFGMGIVFSVLIILWGLLALFRVIFYRPEKKEDKTFEITTPAVPAPAPAPVVAAPVQENFEELAAVAAAAIAASIGREPSSIIVRSIKRKSGWKAPLQDRI